MTVIAIDPSYTRTGIVVYKTPTDYKLISIAPLNKTDKEISVITEGMQQAHSLAQQIKNIIKEHIDEDDDSYIIAVEYPIMATRLGAYLGLISSKLDSLFRVLQCPTVIWIPSVACKSVAKYNNKTELVAYVKASGFVEKFKGDHDQATACVLADIAIRIKEKKYKNSSLTINYTKS